MEFESDARMARSVWQIGAMRGQAIWLGRYVCELRALLWEIEQ